MCEPLRDKKQYKENPRDFEPFFDECDVKSAVMFYKRYRKDSDLLMNEKPDIYKIFLDDRSGKMHEVGLDVWNKEYLVWLFDYCFKDVI